MGDEDIVSVHDPGDAERSYFLAGVISVILYGTFFLCCVWRCYRSFPRFKKSFENKKMVIHVTLTCFAFFQIFYGISFIQYKRDTVWGYCFHMIGQYCVLASFSLIPLIWTKILSYGGNYQAVRIHIFVVLLSNFVITVVQAGLLLHSNSVYERGEFEENVTIVRALILSLSLLSFSVWLLLYGVRLYVFLSSSQVRSNDIIRHERRKAIQRVIFVVLVCSVCYLVRAFCVTLITYDYFNEEYYTDRWFSHLGWYLCSQWIPTLIPAYIMLYVCRPIARVVSPGSRELRLRSASSSYMVDEDMAMRSSSQSDSAGIFSSSSMRCSNMQSSMNSGTQNSSSNESANRFKQYMERYSSDMYNDIDDIASYDYDPEAQDDALRRPYTVDEILQSSDDYGASTSPFEQ